MARRMFSILHLSDLHRSPAEPTDSDSLLAALLADTERYICESPSIPRPEAIVVSGDIISGAGIGTENWQNSIEIQYCIANRFLSELCTRFLDGDRSRLILIPGNHDVCWNTSYQSMQLVPPGDYPADLYETLIAPNSTYRWSWKDRALFRVHDDCLYQQRMSRYWDFAESFYQNVSLPLPIDRGRGFQLFELYDKQIIVAAFDSIYGNDCFAQPGAIDSSAVGQCALALRDNSRSYDLRVAVWHHSIQGPPTQMDYMNVAQVHEMIGHGFQLGLHGHQHKSSTMTTVAHLDRVRTMAIVSAGSLCASTRELPRGVNRQYNVVVVEDDFLHARIHVREMVAGQQFTRKVGIEVPDGIVAVGWTPKLDMAGRRLDASMENERRSTITAERALQEGRDQDAINALRDVDVSRESYARSLRVKALLNLREWTGLTELLDNPLGPSEQITLTIALTERGLVDQAQGRLDAFVEIDDATRRQLQDRIDTRRLMGNNE